jgi:plastocyanin
MSNKLKYYIVTITQQREGEIVVQAESQEEAFAIAENYSPGDEVEWHYTPGSHGVDREGWEDGQLEAEKVTAYKSVNGDAIMPCPDRLVVSAEGEKRKWEAAGAAPGMYSVALEMLTESLEKEKSDED